MRKLLFIPIGLLAAVAACMLPAALRIPFYRRTTLDEVVTVDDAAAACGQTELHGWDLVAYAQQLTARKFSTYSCRNLWDTPRRAFAHGMGYCTQYNLALKALLDGLDIDSRAVYAAKVQVLDDPSWQMGHTWLKVRVDGEVRDVCAGRVGNRPGRVSFVPVSPVRQGTPLMLVLTHLGIIFYCGLLEWGALLSRRPPPAWMFKTR